MCGILGIIAQNREFDLYDIDIAPIRNRGPNGSGQYVNKGVGFYHKRLAVIDNKQTSQQPIISKCGYYILICNGEIYNYQDIKKSHIYEYQTTSDCEAIIACYSAYGVNGFKKLRGMFSFGLYDKKRNKVIIYRDPVGKKPLFYYHDSKKFIFSSSVKAVKNNIRLNLGINKDALLFYLKEGYVPPEISLYDDILSLLPGMLLEVDISTSKYTTQYISAETISYDYFEYDHEHIMNESERLLDRSIERRINGILHPVLLFSGGIDSTVLAKKISIVTGKKLTCISLKPLFPFTYDEPYGRYAAKKLKLNYITTKLDLNHLMENIDKAILLLDQPLAIYSYYFLTYLARKAREFGNVLFMGEGGDEVFYGYSNIRSWFSDNDEPPSDYNYLVGPPCKSRLSMWGKKQITAGLLGHSFVKVDKATAEQQMEARCPYLDWDLMLFVRSIPKNYFIKSGTTKIILKELLKDFPKWFIYRKKIGFAFNFRYLAAPCYRQMYNEIDIDQLKAIGITTLFREFSYVNIFNNFESFWKIYVLSKFIMANS
jgi:asparagine synthase (glutamine-hydrolysing)